jgi:hypothetical protein
MISALLGALEPGHVARRRTKCIYAHPLVSGVCGTQDVYIWGKAIGDPCLPNQQDHVTPVFFEDVP